MNTLTTPTGPLTLAGNTGRQMHGGLQSVLGPAAWARLPPAVRVRFAEPAVAVDYVGNFDVVRASWLGRLLAFACLLLGTPVVPRTGQKVPAIVHVSPTSEGVAWNREYRWPNAGACLVRSTKVIDGRAGLVERLPARLCMPLNVFERRGVLHFVSRGYYFDFGESFRVPLPSLLSPGTTHVEHIDESDGWFRFTMTVTHPLFGEMFYQTGRFKAAGDTL
jgi:Domain of unknown function (DUF4166)